MFCEKKAGKLKYSKSDIFLSNGCMCAITSSEWQITGGLGYLVIATRQFWGKETEGVEGGWNKNCTRKAVHKGEENKYELHYRVMLCCLLMISPAKCL